MNRLPAYARACQGLRYAFLALLASSSLLAWNVSLGQPALPLPSAQPATKDVETRRPVILLPPEGQPEPLPPPRPIGPQPLLPPGLLGTPTSPLDPQGESWASGAQPINLPAALRLAEVANLDIAQAREVVNVARALYDRTRVGILPNFNLGSTYTRHLGNIAKTEGYIIKANKDSLFVGGGPSLAFSFSDALFAPLAAEQVLLSRQAGLRRVNNNTLLAVADAYVAVLRARRRLARVDETLDYLASNEAAPARAGSKGLLPVVEQFFKAQVLEAIKAEVFRVRVEILRRREERRAAVQDYLVATAELARLLRLAPEVPLWPIEDFRQPLPLPGDAWIDRPVEELVRVALGNRPELAENQALVQAAYERVREARLRPFLPNAVVNYSWGDFGGGPDQLGTLPGPSGRIRHFSTRSDFDASLVWRFQALGFGDRIAVREQEALQRQAVLRQMQVRDQVVTQVVQAYEQVQGWKERVAIARAALFDADGQPRGPVFESLRLNFERIRSVEKTRPLEVLDSIRGLSDLLEAYGQAISDYDRARFRLLVAVGLPGDLEPGPAPPPAPPALPQAGQPEPPRR